MVTPSVIDVFHEDCVVSEALTSCGDRFFIFEYQLVRIGIRGFIIMIAMSSNKAIIHCRMSKFTTTSLKCFLAELKSYSC